jgi:hypothetical protein
MEFKPASLAARLVGAVLAAVIGGSTVAASGGLLVERRAGSPAWRASAKPLLPSVPAAAAKGAAVATCADGAKAARKPALPRA